MAAGTEEVIRRWGKQTGSGYVLEVEEADSGVQGRRTLGASGLCTWTAGDVTEMEMSWGRQGEGTRGHQESALVILSWRCLDGPEEVPGGHWAFEPGAHHTKTNKESRAVVTGKPSQVTHPPAQRSPGTHRTMWIGK